VHQAYKATNPPIVVDLTPEVVNVHGVEPNPRNHRLEAIKQLLEVTAEGPTQKVVTWLKAPMLAAVKTSSEEDPREGKVVHMKFYAVPNFKGGR
jgi:hypothetical protein